MTSVTFMLLFSLSITAPDGTQLDEVVNVYSRSFSTEAKCNRFLKNYGSLIRGKGLRTFQDMLKDEYKVELNSVSCSQINKNG